MPQEAKHIDYFKHSRGIAKLFAIILGVILLVHLISHWPLINGRLIVIVSFFTLVNIVFLTRHVGWPESSDIYRIELFVSAVFVLFLLFELIELALIEQLNPSRSDCAHNCRFVDRLKPTIQLCIKSSKSEDKLCKTEELSTALSNYLKNSRNCDEKDDTFDKATLKLMLESLAKQTSDECFDNCRRLAKILNFEWKEFVTPSLLCALFLNQVGEVYILRKLW